MRTRFVFFDLGNVLLRFSIEKMGRQGAEVVACEPNELLKAVFAGGMQKKLECGEISELDFYESFCAEVGKRPDPAALARALNDIFSVVEEMQPFLKYLVDRDIPRGVLSNTGTGHWNHCTATYPFLLQSIPDNHVLSFRVGAMKPDVRIYEAALETARKAVPGIEANEILFLDDLEANVDAACEFGLDAVQFSDAEQLLEELEFRGLTPD